MSSFIEKLREHSRLIKIEIILLVTLLFLGAVFGIPPAMEIVHPEYFTATNITDLHMTMDMITDAFLYVLPWILLINVVILLIPFIYGKISERML